MVNYAALMIVFSFICGTFGIDRLNINHSPVLYFKNKGYPSSFPNGIISSTMPVEEHQFVQDFNQLAATQKMVIFIVNDLSPEHFNIKNVHDERGFENLATNVNIVKYMPYVENAANNEVTRNVAERYELTYANELRPTPNENAQIVIVSLPEQHSGETLFQYMARIDRACYAVSQTDEYKDAMFMLTSKKNSHLEKLHLRKTRDTNSQTSNDEGHVYASVNSLVYFKKLLKRSKETKVQDTEIPVRTVTTNPDLANKEITINFDCDPAISLKFQLDNQHYIKLNTSKSTIGGKPFSLNTEVYMDENFSYACASSLFFQLKDDGLYFENLQIQLNFTNAGENLQRFNEAFDCVGFTSPGIWSGLFIVLLLLSIVATGITYIMDIKTMDKFDDPKGKTITINPNE